MRRGQRKHVDPTVQAARITRRGTFVTAAATVVAALITAIIAAYNVGSDQGEANATPSTVTVVSPVTTSASGSGPASPTDDASSAGDASAQIRLDDGTGVDLDVPDPRAVEANGPNGDIDLYFDSGLAVNRSAMYYFSGTENEAAVGCPKAVANDRPAPGGATVVTAGGQFCIRTSDGTIGWISCNDAEYSSSRTGYIVLNYRLFG